MNIDFKVIQLAYRKFKSLVYYDKTKLFLRERLAKFECDPGFDNKLKAILKVVNSNDPCRDDLFIKWLNDVQFRVVPKSVTIANDVCATAKEQTEGGTFITNVTSAKDLWVDKVNYFFDGPIELHLIAVLWIMFEGRFLDKQLDNECYGNRTETDLMDTKDDSLGLFRKYHELYAQWRDNGIRKAKQLLTEDKTSVFILGLDVQEYYYHINLDYNIIAKSIAVSKSDESENEHSQLILCLQEIHSKYKDKIKKYLKITHPGICPNIIGLPIGLCSSPLLANWYLRDFDKDIKTIVRPNYYGRYVDDILMVIAVTEKPKLNESNLISNYIEHVLVKTEILKKLEDERYEIINPGGLFLQVKKCMLQYFDVTHSIAGLEKFQKKLQESGSDFRLLAVDEADNSIENVAYDLLFDGSTNKFRSVKGMAENRFELAKHLAKQTILHLLTDDKLNLDISSGLRLFFKGKNAIEFHDLWERVITFFFIANSVKDADEFKNIIQYEIEKVKYPLCAEGKKDEPLISLELLRYLKEHLQLSYTLSASLDHNSEKSSSCDIQPEYAFREANLIRHHFVNIPLLNYTDYQGNFKDRIIQNEVHTECRKLCFSPRYVNFDECMVLAKTKDILFDDIIKHAKENEISIQKYPFNTAKNIYETINKKKYINSEWAHTKRGKYDEIKIGLSFPSHHENIQIALANIPIDHENIESSYLSRPILSRERIKPLASLLNKISRYHSAIGKTIDLLIFPEVSIPYSWEPMLVIWARRNNIGLICGLEHRIYKDIAYNEILAALPYISNDKHTSCMPIRRLKRFYSPEEEFELVNNKVKLPPRQSERFQLIRWCGASFAIYNCYELANITDRSLFKGKVDFIVVSEFNKDVNYFSNIIESAARDIHCYVIQVNDSQYGDSRIVRPSKTELMNPVRIKGGDNLTFLTINLNLKDLRDHQRKGYGLQKESSEFKPTPPGFLTKDVDERIRLGK